MMAAKAARRWQTDHGTKRSAWPQLVPGFVFAVLALTITPVALADGREGLEEIVLPSFQPLTVDGSTIVLGGGRRYEWSQTSLLPTQLRSRSQKYVGELELRARIDNKWHVINASAPPVVLQNNGHDATVTTRGEVTGLLAVTATTRVEYDGFAAIRLDIEPQKRVNLERFEIRTSLLAGTAVQSLQFHADTVRKRRKQFVFPASYSGPFLNALGVADGEKSFWWFADTGEGRVEGKLPSQTLRANGDSLEFTDLLIQNADISDPIQIGLNFLVTPVKDGTDWRNINVARTSAKREEGLGNVVLWWIDAFAHETLPYTDFPIGSTARLPAADVKHYKGAAGSRQRIRKARDLGMSLLPYFSAHALSAVDPAFLRYGDRWRVVPDFVVPSSSDGPYTSDLKRPWLSHRSVAYSDYLLARFSHLIDELGFDGLYFDQGTPVPSKNREHRWFDHKGRERAATDIIGMRSFFKRLATLFHTKGLPGHIFVHNSSSPIVPAFTFITGMVQGEEYRIRLQEPDYLPSTDVDEIRTAFSPNQYGVGSVWLSELWSSRVRPKRFVNEPEWLATEQYREAAQGFHGLALIHDVATWSHGTKELREFLVELRQSLQREKAELIGYWQQENYSSKSPLLVSHYRPDTNMSMITVILNRSDTRRIVLVHDISRLRGCGVDSPETVSSIRGPIPVLSDSGIRASVPPSDFVVFRTHFTTPADTGCSH